MLFMLIITFSVVAYFCLALYISYQSIMARLVAEPFEEVEIHTLYPDFKPEIVEVVEDDENIVWADPRIDAFGPVASTPVNVPADEQLEDKWSRIEAAPWLKPIEVRFQPLHAPALDATPNTGTTTISTPPTDDHSDSVKSDYKNDKE